MQICVQIKRRYVRNSAYIFSVWVTLTFQTPVPLAFLELKAILIDPLNELWSGFAELGLVVLQELLSDP